MSNLLLTIPGLPTAGAVLRRIALPFLLFALVLAGLLLLSWMMLLPVATAIELDGVSRTPEDLERAAAELQAKISALEEQREAFLLPLRGSVYGALNDRKLLQASVLPAIDQLEELGSSLIPDHPDAVSFASFRFRAGDRTLSVSGDIRNVGPRSVTALAQFLEEVRRLPSAVSVESKRFAREEDPAIGVHSPFQLTIVLP